METLKVGDKVRIVLSPNKEVYRPAALLVRIGLIFKIIQIESKDIKKLVRVEGLDWWIDINDCEKIS